MRTDSTNLSEQAVTAARASIRELYGEEYLPPQERVYRSRVKNAQEAHEAIRPAGDRIRTPDAVAGELDADERDDTEAEAQLPSLDEGEAVRCEVLAPVGHETKPPARYTDASLVKEL